VQVEAAPVGTLGDAELGPVGPHVGEGDVGGLGHDVAELAGHLEARLAVEGGGLDRQHVAAGAGDGEAGGHAGAVAPVVVVAGESGTPERRAQVVHGDHHRGGRGTVLGTGTVTGCAGHGVDRIRRGRRVTRLVAEGVDPDLVPVT